MKILHCFWLLNAVALQALAWCGNKSYIERRASLTQDKHTMTTPNPSIAHQASHSVATTVLCSFLLTSSVAAPSRAYEANDYASETVQTAVKALRDSGSDSAATVKAYENVAEIITEGKGVGGEINFQGVQLDRGYIADEDTTIYNPGLTLLTESEKDRLVEAVVATKKSVGSNWNADTQAGFEFLLEKLDPLHMYELRGYLGIVPFYGAAVYLAALAVQQVARDLFPVAYIAGVLAIFGPAIALVLIGV